MSFNVKSTAGLPATSPVVALVRLDGETGCSGKPLKQLDCSADAGSKLVEATLVVSGVGLVPGVPSRQASVPCSA